MQKLTIEERVQQLYEDVLELERYDEAERERIEKISGDWQQLGEREQGRQDWYCRAMQACNESLRGSWDALDAAVKNYKLELSEIRTRDGCRCTEANDLRKLAEDRLDRIAARGWLAAERKQAEVVRQAAEEAQVRQEVNEAEQPQQAANPSDWDWDDFIIYGPYLIGAIVSFVGLCSINEPKNAADVVILLLFCIPLSLLAGPVVAIMAYILPAIIAFWAVVVGIPALIGVAGWYLAVEIGGDAGKVVADVTGWAAVLAFLFLMWKTTTGGVEGPYDDDCAGEDEGDW